MNGVELKRWALIGMVNAAVGVSDRERAVAFHNTRAGTSDVTVKAPTFVGNAGKVFPGTITSRFFVEVTLSTCFRDILRCVVLLRIVRREWRGARDRREGFLRVVLERLFAAKRRDRILGGKTVTHVDHFTVPVVGKAEMSEVRG